jgi:hypothetical protein
MECSAQFMDCVIREDVEVTSIGIEVSTPTSSPRQHRSGHARAFRRDQWDPARGERGVGDNLRNRANLKVKISG